MIAIPIFTGKTFQTIVVVCLLTSFLAACSPQYTPTPTIPLVPTSTEAMITHTPTPKIPGLVTVYEQLIGIWLSTCGAGACTLEFKSNGSYSIEYVNRTETGIKSVETGKVTFQDEILHFVSADTGYCAFDNHPDGDYTAVLFYIEEDLYLRLTPAPNDRCSDRKRMYGHDMLFYGE